MRSRSPGPPGPRARAVEHPAKLNTPARRKLRVANLLLVAGANLRDMHSRSHIEAMHLDLTDEETAALTKELHDIVENDRYPFSPRIRTLRAILAKLRR